VGIRVRPIVRGIVRSVENVRSAVARAALGKGAGEKNALYLFYDLESCPITFDFAWTLCAAECRRRELGLDAMHVIFVPAANWEIGSESKHYLSIVDGSAREWRFSNVLVPLCGLLPSVRGYELASTRDMAAMRNALGVSHTFPSEYSTTLPDFSSATKMVLDYAKTGLEVRHLRACESSKRYIRRWISTKGRGRRLVSVTVRQYSYQPYRNSNMEAWKEFARSLDPSSYFVVFIPETDEALGQLPEDYDGFAVLPEAAFNLRLRTALYEEAWLNLSVNSGPFVTTFLNARTRCIMLKVLGSNSPPEAEALVRRLGFDVGSQFPFSDPTQRVFWYEDDDLDVIGEAFQDMTRTIDTSLPGDDSSQ
jgi:hypothetical protein